MRGSTAPGTSDAGAHENPFAARTWRRARIGRGVSLEDIVERPYKVLYGSRVLARTRAPAHASTVHHATRTERDALPDGDTCSRTPGEPAGRSRAARSPPGHRQRHGAVRTHRRPRVGPHWFIDERDLASFAATYRRPLNAPRRQQRRPVVSPEILKWLAEWDDATITELAVVVEMHEGNIRKHLCLAEVLGLAGRDEFSRWRLTPEGRAQL